MDSSEHSRNSSSDAGENDIKFRECDDMMTRRLAGNLPAPLRKKKNEENYKRFITPSGDPMSYVRQHMRSRSMSDIEVQNAEKSHERDERNSRYEEMQQLKVMLKEEEDTWTSKLDNWKQRRRSATLDVRKRKEDRDSVVQQPSTSLRRKPKTYKEMVEDKKRREMGLFDGDDHLISNLHLSSDEEDQDRGKKKTKRVPYRGAVSVPNIRQLGPNRLSVRSPSPGATKVVVKPVKYTSKVTAVINHVPTESEDSSDLSKTENWNHADPRNNDEAKASYPEPNHSIPHRKPTSPETVVTPTVNKPAYTAISRPRSQSPPASTPSYSSKATVVMRGKSPNSNRERPKSAYSLSDRASTLPRNYHAYSAPKPFVPGTSSFVQFRKTAFANKRNMWENMAHQEPELPKSAPQPLSSLLRHDKARLHDTDHEADKPNLNGVDPAHDNAESLPVPPKQSGIDGKSKHDTSPPWKRSEPANTEPNPLHNSVPETNRHLWQRPNNANDEPDSKTSYRRVNAPRASWTKSATLPAQSRYSSFEAKVEPVETQPEKKAPSHNGTSLEPPLQYSKQKSPRSPSGGSESLFDDMKICINQRPKSEKGFGFTVRGGDDGKPVIVSTVSPGGAADICQLCVGDEILAINEVRLSSSLTQDGIVQLIVDSVITGNLSLDIRRYGKVKKANPLRLSSTKVVMTSGGFVQVRSDKGKAPVVSTKMFNGNSSNIINKQEEKSPDFVSPHELPLPPPPEDLEPPKRQSAMSRLSPKKTSPSYRTTSPLSNLIHAAKSTQPRPQGKENHRRETPSPVVRDHSPLDNDDSLQEEVLKAQHDLEIEESYLNSERKHHDKNNALRMQLLEEQRLLDEREAKREEEKRKRIEDAKAEELKLEEELRRIEAQKLEQQKRREEEKRRLMESQPTSRTHMNPTFDQGGMNHWLIEEAERSRLAEEEGRSRINAIDYSRDAGSTGALPDHVIQRLTQRSQPQRGSQSGNPHLPGSLTDYWNDPSTQATLL